MKDEIKRICFVYTRQLTKDYDFYYRPQNINQKSQYNLIAAIEEQYQTLGFYKKTQEVFNSGWYKLPFEDNKIIIFRIVKDGRRDLCNRLIRRYEGALVTNINQETIKLVEECLEEIQADTNNYGYGLIVYNKKLT